MATVRRSRASARKVARKPARTRGARPPRRGEPPLALREAAEAAAHAAPRARPGDGFTGSAADFVPALPTLETLRTAAERCHGCALYEHATQTVFGEGPATARVVFVGEQPGDQEDRAGKPFVGPSGKLLDRALEAAGIDRDDVYVTNAVKHFKWERGEKGKRRIHKKPSDSEITACHPWLDAELALLRPEVVVCLGATAARAILGKEFRVTRERGKPVRTSSLAPVVVATVHPSAVLRSPAAYRERAEEEFFRDIAVVAGVL